LISGEPRRKEKEGKRKTFDEKKFRGGGGGGGIFLWTRGEQRVS
jgi:hypothetical protein